MAVARRLFPFDQSNSQSQCQQFRGKRGKPNPIAAQQDRQTENSRRFYSNHQNWRHTAGRGAFSAAEAPKTQEALMAFKFLGQRQLGKLPSRWVSTILMVAIGDAGDAQTGPLYPVGGPAHIGKAVAELVGQHGGLPGDAAEIGQGGRGWGRASPHSLLILQRPYFSASASPSPRAVLENFLSIPVTVITSRTMAVI